MNILQMLSQELNLPLWKVENTVNLIDEGNTIPFIARYRKEKTGELTDDILRDLFDRLNYLRALNARKDEVRRLIDEQGKLTDELKLKIENATVMVEVEDIYRPYKQKKRTRATIAKEKGLEPLADLIFAQEFNGTIKEIAKDYIDVEKDVHSTIDAINGALDIIAENISDIAELRKKLREFTYRTGVLKVKKKKEDVSVYAMYSDYKEPVNKVLNHRILAIDRGEKEEFLSVSIDIDENRSFEIIADFTIKNKSLDTYYYMELANKDSYKRLIAPSIEREIRTILNERAQEEAIKLFNRNLKNLIMTPPLKDKVILGLDPAYRTGCKIAVINKTGFVLDTTVIYPTPPHNKIEEAKKTLLQLIEKHTVNVIAIGNGTASKESEIFIADMIKEFNLSLSYFIVSEAGASVYSASKLAQDEFPEFDVSLRSAVSIARRLLDPLSELVKIDPKAIGVGQYQHDLNQKKLSESLGGAVEESVNKVGVNINCASWSLLSYVAGINATLAKNIVSYRDENGSFKSRKDLLKVAKLGPKAYTQCAGFLRIPESKHILDKTAVHPESYEATKKMLTALDYTLEDVDKGKLSDLKERIKSFSIDNIAALCGIGVPTLRDITEELLKPGRDPRDELPMIALRKDVMSVDDIRADMILTGTVRNVTDFGAFIDIGVHQDGLCHISELSNKYIKHPFEVVSVGDIVQVKVLDIDAAKKRISLTIKNI